MDDAITVAGFGFRREALLASLIEALEQLHERYGAIDRLAATRTMWPLVQELGRVRGIAVIPVADAALPAAATITRSRHSLRARGTGSVAEAVALLAAGPGAELLGPRLVSMDRLATAAMARGSLQTTALDHAALKPASCASPIKMLIYKPVNSAFSADFALPGRRS